MNTCEVCGKPTGLKLVALPFCPDHYEKETETEHWDHVHRDSDRAMAKRLHPSGKGPRYRARDWLQKRDPETGRTTA